MYSILRSVSGNPKSSTQEPDFPGCTTPEATASKYASYLKTILSTSQPKVLRHRGRSYLKEVRSSLCDPSQHTTFCSHFSLSELKHALAQLPSSSSAGPDNIAYPMLTHLPQESLDFLLYIFNLSWTSHTFPSCWKTSTIIPIHKSGKPTNQPSSFRPISLTSCISKLFERLVLARVSFLLESSNILTSAQAGFRPGRSTLDQILLLSQSISDGFQSKPPLRSVLATVDFSKAFDSVWHPALFHKLLSSGLPSCFVRWVQSFLADRRASVRYKNQLSCPFCIRRGVPQGSVLGPVLFLLFVNDIPSVLPSSVHTSLYADDLAIWSSSSIVSRATDLVQSALHKLSEWSKFWALPLNPNKCETSFFSTDHHQAKLKPQLFLDDFPLRFNPKPTFLGVTLDRSLSFVPHIHSLKAKFFPRLKALRSIASATWGPSKESLCHLYKSFLRTILCYASPGWFPFISPSSLLPLERLHRSACRVITGCLSSSPVSLLLLESGLSPLQTTLVHQSLSFFEKSLRLPDSFPLSSLSNRVISHRLTRQSWRSFCLGHSLSNALPASREPLVLCPPFPPWNPPTLTVNTSIPHCSKATPQQERYDLAVQHIQSLEHTGVTLWTDGSVPSLFGQGGAGVFMQCSKCSTSHSISSPAGPISSSFTAEISALLIGLDWCVAHSSQCPFSSLLVLSDSKSALTTLSSRPDFLMPKTLWCIWFLISTLAERVQLTLQWVPGHTNIPGNETADSLANQGALISSSSIPASLSPCTSFFKYSLYHSWRRSVSSKLLSCQVPQVSPEELALSRSTRCALSRLRCNGHSLLLSSYLVRIGRQEDPSCSACGNPTQDLFHLLLDCPASDRLRCTIFGASLSPLDLWSRPWGVARLLGLRGVPPRPHPQEGIG